MKYLSLKMKINRCKKAKKILNFYCNNFGFRKPFQILIDGTFCFAGCEEQVNIKDQLVKYLTDNIRFLTTKCIIIETEKIAKKTRRALIVLKQFQLTECSHHEDVVSGADCILSMMQANEENHFIIATQDRDLQFKLRGIPGVPLLYLCGKAITLGRPSHISLEKAQSFRETIFSNQINSIKQIKESIGLEETPIVLKKKRKIKGPNPLSCKKKKVIPITNKTHAPPINKRTRKRNHKKI